MGIESIPPQEQPVARNEVVAAFRAFVACGITDPVDLDETDLEVKAANALLEKWVAQEKERTAGDPAAARQFNIERTTLYVDAGFTNPSYVEDVHEWLDQDTENILNPSEFEREPVSYEQVLAAVQSLHDAGVTNLRDIKNQNVKNALELVGAWRSQNGIPDVGADGQRVRGIDSPEKAEGIAKLVMLWIDAGYANRERLRDALDALTNVYMDAVQEEAGEEVRVVFDSAIKFLEAKLSPPDSKKEKKDQVAVEIEGRLEVARQLVRDGKTTDAIGRLTAIVWSGDAKFCKYFLKHQEEKKRITELRDAIRDGKDLSEYGL